jgi:hypothetical protein
MFLVTLEGPSRKKVPKQVPEKSVVSSNTDDLESMNGARAPIDSEDKGSHVAFRGATCCVPLLLTGWLCHISHRNHVMSNILLRLTGSYLEDSYILCLISSCHTVNLHHPSHPSKFFLKGPQMHRPHRLPWETYSAIAAPPWLALVAVAKSPKPLLLKDSAEG